MIRQLQFFVAIFLAFSSIGFAQKCSELTAIIDKTYGFKPSKLTAEQIDAKSAEMDKVWNLIGNNSKELLPCLRAEINRRNGDSFFRFNASNLLYKHDQSHETKKLMIETYAGADLADINLRYWLPYMAAFGKEGLDVTKPAEAWLRFPKSIYYLPQHGTRPVDKGTGALALLGSMDESVATPALAKLVGEENTDFRSIAIWLLVNQATIESDREVRALSSKLPKPLADKLVQDIISPRLIEPRSGVPKTTRENFIKAMTELIEDKPEAWISLTGEVADGEKDMVAVLTKADLPLIRKVRRYYAANATPHSPEWYTTFTQVINTVVARSEQKSKQN
ncbi:MAG: hypothetical protein WKF92_12215 [Pyrinomonadaceae bacterium]